MTWLSLRRHGQGSEDEDADDQSETNVVDSRDNPLEQMGVNVLCKSIAAVNRSLNRLRFGEHLARQQQHQHKARPLCQSAAFD